MKNNLNTILSQILKIMMIFFLLISSVYIFMHLFFYKSHTFIIVDNVQDDRASFITKSLKKIAESSAFTKVMDSQDVLQLISIFAIFGGVLAYIFQTIVKADLINENEKAKLDNRRFTEAQAFKTIGLVGYYHYEMVREIDEKDEEEENEDDDDICGKEDLLNKNVLLDDAIKQTYKAMEFASELNEKDFNHGPLLYICKNNLAWYLAERKNENDAEEACALINDCIEKLHTYPTHAHAWKSTLCFVNERFKKQTKC